MLLKLIVLMKNSLKRFYGRKNKTINVPENRVLSDIDRRCLQDILSHLTNSSTDCYVIKSNAHKNLFFCNCRTNTSEVTFLILKIDDHLPGRSFKKPSNGFHTTEK